MPTYDDPRSELLGIAEQVRHLHAEHQRAGAESATRRKLEARMEDEAAHLDRRLAAVVPDEADREAWRAHARHGAPAPERPEHAERAEGAAEAAPERPSGRRPWPR
jgi:hypothetical protein